MRVPPSLHGDKPLTGEAQRHLTRQERVLIWILATYLGVLCAAAVWFSATFEAPFSFGTSLHEFGENLLFCVAVGGGIPSLICLVLLPTCPRSHGRRWVLRVASWLCLLFPMALIGGEILMVTESPDPLIFVGMVFYAYLLYGVLLLVAGVGALLYRVCSGCRKP